MSGFLLNLLTYYPAKQLIVCLAFNVISFKYIMQDQQVPEFTSNLPFCTDAKALAAVLPHHVLVIH